MTSHASKPSKLPAGFAQLLGRTVGAMQFASASSAEYSPYTTTLLQEGARALEQWLVEFRLHGSKRRSEDVLALLRSLEAEAVALVANRINFEEQLKSHLSRICEKVEDGIAERRLSPEMGAVLTDKANALANAPRSGGRGAMAALHSAACAIEQSVDEMLHGGHENRRRFNGRDIRA